MPLRNQLCFFDEGAGAVLAGAADLGPRFFDGLTDITFFNSILT
ncbi:hypothetical protein N9E54_03885 [Alphaproteobacteria bacterium]|nr:hypothetical protein [Alphaproteobacteria bacterium]